MLPYFVAPRTRAAAVTLAAGAASALAAGDAVAQRTAPLQVDQIVITATGREQSVADVQASVEVITREDLARTPGNTVIEALRQAVGVDARSSGANSSVSIRGQIPSAGSAVLILVDGLPRTGKFGGDNLNLISVESVERIEVIRGPMSALYGADASGGVINIITRAPSSEPSANIRSTIGTSATNDGDGRESFVLGATAEAGAGPTAHRLSFDTRHANPFRYDTSTRDDLSGIEHYGLAYQGRWTVTPAHQITLQAEVYRQEDTFDNRQLTPPFTAYEQLEEETRLFGALRYLGEVGPGELSIDGSYGHTSGSANRNIVVEETDFSQALLQGRYFLSFSGVEAGGVNLGDHGLLIGAGIQHDDIEVDIFQQSEARTNEFLFVQDEWIPTDWLSIVAGLRLDHFSDFGTQLTPRITVGSRGDGLTWRLGYGQAFRAPTLTEQYSRFTRGRFLIVGDPNLSAEESVSYEAAIGWRGAKGQIEAILHRSEIDGLIEAVATGNTVGGLSEVKYQNIDEAVIQGVEIAGDVMPIDNLLLRGSYAYLDAVDGQTDQRLTDRARHTVKASATYQLGALSATLGGRLMLDYYGTDPDLPRGSPPFDSNFYSIDLNVGYALTESAQLRIGVDNITDQHVPSNYSSTRSIEDPAGRFVYMTLEMKF